MAKFSDAEHQGCLFIRILLSESCSLGPGKAALLEAIAATGAIAAAGRQTGMSYKKTRDLVDQLNAGFVSPLITATVGGKSFGGASLTPLGQEVLSRYKAVERAASAAAQAELIELAKIVRRN
jgi:molybdate transport system regulatory protein